MMYKICVGGIEVYCQDLIVDQEMNQYVYFISVSGYQTAVKGILANLLKGSMLNVEINREIHWIDRVRDNYVTRIKKMPSGYCHAVAIPKMALPRQNEENRTDDFLLITSDPGEVRNYFYRHLDQRTEIPLHPSWTDWLWELFKTNEWIERLNTLIGDYTGYLISIHQGELLHEITQTIQLKVPQIVNCMRQNPKSITGGDNGNRIKPENLS
jgi:hypothetical protein